MALWQPMVVESRGGIVDLISERKRERERDLIAMVAKIVRRGGSDDGGVVVAVVEKERVERENVDLF